MSLKPIRSSEGASGFALRRRHNESGNPETVGALVDVNAYGSRENRDAACMIPARRTPWQGDLGG